MTRWHARFAAPAASRFCIPSFVLGGVSVEGVDVGAVCVRFGEVC
jgi:hypothetical protein